MLEMIKLVRTMKKYTIITIVIIGIVLGFLTGVYLYKIKQIDDNKTEIIAETIEDECTAIGELSNGNLEEFIKTNSEEEKISPNCVITLKVYHEACQHLIETRKNIEDVEVNMTEEELKERFKSWEVQKFTPTEIVLYKEVKEFCDEHYLLKEKDGNIAIFKLDENNNQTFLETTDISTEYLTEEDLKNIQKGITIYTKKELNKMIEDFE